MSHWYGKTPNEWCHYHNFSTNYKRISILMHNALIDYKADNIRMYWNYRNNRRLMKHWYGAVSRLAHNAFVTSGT